MENKQKNKGRRGFLFGILGFFVGYITALASIPSLQHLTSLWFRIANNPKTLTNVEINLFGLVKGETMAVTWQGKTIYIIRRTEEMITAMESAPDEIYVDTYSKLDNLPSNFSNKLRSLNPNYLVVNGMCTHLGCATAPVLPGKLEYFPEGGFICGCHGGKFDLSGRALAETPPPQNLYVPPYYFKDENTIIIGQSENG